MKKIIALIVLLCLVNISTAAITCEWKDSIKKVGDGLYSITFTLISDNSLNVAAFDGWFTCSYMNQNWVESTPPVPNIITPLRDILGSYTFEDCKIDESTDSHFLLTRNQLVIKTNPSETETELTGKFGILPENQGGVSATRLAFAQIVMHENDTFILSGKASDSAGNSSILSVGGKVEISQDVGSDGTDDSSGTDNTGGTDNTDGTNNTGGSDNTGGTDNTGGADDTIDDVLPGARCTGIGMIVALSIFFGFAFVSESKRS